MSLIRNSHRNSYHCSYKQTHCPHMLAQALLIHDDIGWTHLWLESTREAIQCQNSIGIVVLTRRPSEVVVLLPFIRWYKYSILIMYRNVFILNVYLIPNLFDFASANSSEWSTISLSILLLLTGSMFWHALAAWHEDVISRIDPLWKEGRWEANRQKGCALADNVINGITQWSHTHL